MLKTVLITGAAGGLGRALAEHFLSMNWQVVATDSDDLSMACLMDHAHVDVLKMDVTDNVSVTEVFRFVKSKYTFLDLIINNAAIDAYFPLSEAPVELFRKVFEVNVFGSYRVNQVFIPLLKQPGGRILHIGSESLNLTLPFMPYPLSKKLMEGYARALRMELRFLGIDVVIIRPGAIDTKLLETVRKLQPADGKWRLGKQFERFAGAASGEIGKTLAPGEAAAFIYRVACLPKPGAVYRINNMIQLRLATLVPFRWLEKLIYRKLN
jgi:NAD(P)-dependent dehydrogenase (short-subunit alcohol dehydrogenase family)